MRLAAFAAFAAACGATQPPPVGGDLPAGITPAGVAARLELTGAQIAAVVPADAAGWLWPSIVDSHVHLAYWPVADRLAAAGVGAAIDLAAPDRALATPAPLHVLGAGPILTRPGGYPLATWGADGYGIGCADAACVTAAVARLAATGARVIKLAVDDGGLPAELVAVAVGAAHARGLKVAVHALSDAAAARAAAAGADLLAHTPVEPLVPATVEAWRGRAVISTLAAFGGSAATIDNLRALRASGVTVLYGTDLGNTRDPGPSAAEIELLGQAGLDAAAITEAMTTVPAAYWALPFGAIAPGAEATFLVLDRDPREDARALLSPRAVWLRGLRVR